jgi:hypothetical protein
MISLIKVWKDKDTSGKVTNVGEKEYFMDSRTPLEGLESCKHPDKLGKEIECTKLIYPNKFVIVKGTPMELMVKMRDANIAPTLLVDIYAAGYTIKQFMEQNESLNNLNI